MDYDLNYQEDTGDVDVNAIKNKIGDICEADGTYECTTCSDEVEWKKGDKFGACENCGDDHLTWDPVGG